MADGTHKPIKDVRLGDRVVATDPESGQQGARRVERVFVHDDTVVDLDVNGEVITTTEDHPFWSATDRRFERADELAPEEQVLTADAGSIAVVEFRRGTRRNALAYNLSIEGVHTYHVGESEILVHNTCSLLPGLPSSAPKPLGRGSTGRSTPGSLTEQLAMEEVRSAPGGTRIRKVMMSDPRWPSVEGWEKMQQLVNGVNVHYVRNAATGAVDDFKFVTGQ